MKKGLFKRKPSLIHMPNEDDPFKGILLSIDDFAPVKEKFDKALITKGYDILTSVVWEFNIPAKFAGTGFEAPANDLLGNKLQNLMDENVLAKHIFVMFFPEDEKTYCIISWLKENDDIFAGYYEQLKKLDEKNRKNYINNILPIVSENITINPEVWDKWEQYKKDEFGSLIWGLDTIAEMFGEKLNRLEPPSYDLFEL